MKTKNDKVRQLTSESDISLYLERYLKLKACGKREELKVPVLKNYYESLADYENDANEISRIKEENERIKKHNEKYFRLRDLISKTIENSIPFYVWLRFKALGKYYAIGVSTGTWGGYCQGLSVQDLSETKIEDLHKLEHTTYYP